METTADVGGLVLGLDGNFNKDVALYDQTNRYIVDANTGATAIQWQYSFNPDSTDGFIDFPTNGSSLSDIVAATADITTIFPASGSSLSVYFRYSVTPPVSGLMGYCYFKLNLTYTVEQQPAAVVPEVNYDIIWLGLSSPSSINAEGTYDDRLKFPLVEDQNGVLSIDNSQEITMAPLDAVHTASETTRAKIAEWAADQTEDYFISVTQGTGTTNVRAYVKPAQHPTRAPRE